MRKEQQLFNLNKWFNCFEFFIYISSFNFKALQKWVNKYYVYKMILYYIFCCVCVAGGRLLAHLREMIALCKAKDHYHPEMILFFFLALSSLQFFFHLFIYAHSMINDAQPKIWMFCMLVEINQMKKRK